MTERKVALTDKEIEHLIDLTRRDSSPRMYSVANPDILISRDIMEKLQRLIIEKPVCCSTYEEYLAKHVNSGFTAT